MCRHFTWHRLKHGLQLWCWCHGSLVPRLTSGTRLASWVSLEKPFFLIKMLLWCTKISWSDWLDTAAGSTDCSNTRAELFYSGVILMFMVQCWHQHHNHCQPGNVLPQLSCEVHLYSMCMHMKQNILCSWNFFYSQSIILIAVDHVHSETSIVFFLIMPGATAH